MANELHLPLDREARDRLAAAAAAHAMTPEEYARHLIEEGLGRRFTHALDSLRGELSALVAAEPPQPSRPLVALGGDEVPMSSRDLRQDRDAA
jgi:hypothetical protein